MAIDLIKAVEEKYLKKEKPSYQVGDIVGVHQRVVEEGRSRVQVFEGRIIARKGSGLQESICVRRITFGEGVERVFPLHSPEVVKIQLVKEGPVRRAKLYYTRKKLGAK
jgi:large subunit ribosomal protein L19